MKVAALLVNFRDAHGTAAAARSVRDDDPATGIVVVDNSDDEGHWQALRDALPEGVHAVRATANLGFGCGCNLAMRHTAAAALLLVNPDVRLRRGCTAALREALLASPRLGAVAPRQSLDAEGAWLLPPAWLPTALRAWATEKALRSPTWQARWSAAIQAEQLRSWRATRPLRQRALSGAVMMVRREALAATAAAWGVPDDTLFDPRFFMYFEDSDLCLRLRRGRWHLALVPQAQAVHAWHNAPHKHALMREGMQTFFDRHHGPGDRWQARREALLAAGGASALPEAAEPLAGDLLRIDAAPAEDWSVELSPNPTLWPAVGRLGRGPATVPLAPVLRALSGGNPVWIRATIGHGRQARPLGRWRGAVGDGAVSTVADAAVSDGAGVRPASATAP